MSGVPDWITGVFVVILIFITLENVLFRRKFTLMLQSLYVQRHFSQLTRESRIFNDRVFLFDLVTIFLTQGLLIYLLINIFFSGICHIFSPIVLFGLSVAGVMVDYLLKSLVTFIFTSLFDYSEERHHYFLYKLLYQTANSLILFPILIVTVYTGIKEILWIYLLVFIGNYTVMSYRLFTLNPKKNNLFQFFIYFCTFEILPYFVIVKLLFLLEQKGF